MATHFEPGRYMVRILDQYFTESKQKKTLGFVLVFRPLHCLDSDAVLTPHQRETIWWITDKTVHWVLHDLHELGYTGSILSGVDPAAEGFHDFREQEIEMACWHEAGSNGDDDYERWGLRAPRMATPLKDRSQVQRFDRVLAGEPVPDASLPRGIRPKPVAVAADDKLEITDDDVPF